MTFFYFSCPLLFRKFWTIEFISVQCLKEVCKNYINLTKLGPPYRDLNQVAALNHSTCLHFLSFSFFNIIPSVTSEFKFQILPRPGAILVCSNPKFIHVRKLHRGQRHEKNERSVQCTEASGMKIKVLYSAPRPAAWELKVRTVHRGQRHEN